MRALNAGAHSDGGKPSCGSEWQHDGFLRGLHRDMTFRLLTRFGSSFAVAIAALSVEGFLRWAAMKQATVPTYWSLRATRLLHGPALCRLPGQRARWRRARRHRAGARSQAARGEQPSGPAGVAAAQANAAGDAPATARKAGVMDTDADLFIVRVPRRVCDVPECGTILSRYNPTAPPFPRAPQAGRSDRLCLRRTDHRQLSTVPRLPARTEGRMKVLACILKQLLGCRHDRQTWCFTDRSGLYCCCLDCGERWLIRRSSPPATRRCSFPAIEALAAADCRLQ